MPQMGPVSQDVHEGDLIPRVRRIGIRLFHDTLRNTTYLVTHPSRVYRQPFLCPGCKAAHHMKTIHLVLDDQGSVIVSKGVFHELQEAGMPGLSVANEVEDPPSKTIVVNLGPQVFQEEHVETAGGRLAVVRKRFWRRRKNG